MNISLPDALKSFFDEQVDRRGFGTSSEYVRELIRKDQDRQRLRGLLLAGAASPPAEGLADSRYFAKLRARARKGAKPVVPRERAIRDIDEALDHYLDHASPGGAVGFVDALEKAYLQIGRHPGSGSSRYAHELDLPGLRSWTLARYPHVVFYFELADQVDVWRVLLSERDMPGWLGEP